MFVYRTPDEQFKAYERFLRKKNYKKAYYALESLIDEFPDDTKLLVDMVNLCLGELKNPEKARMWLYTLLERRTFWQDYALLSKVEAGLDLDSAKENLQTARKLARQWPGNLTQDVVTQQLADSASAIEHFTIAARKEKYQDCQKRSEIDQKKAVPPKQMKSEHEVEAQDDDASSELPSDEESKTQTEEKPAKIQEKTYSVAVRFFPPDEDDLEEFKTTQVSTLEDARMFIQYTQLTIQGGFDELLCINVLQGVDHYWYQLETVKKVLKHFRGRVLLCDEVGLGKTVEAGMLLKEYLMRGMAQNVLILTPPPLVSQWKEEMAVKFGIDFVSTDDSAFTDDPEGFWEKPFVIASIHTAKTKKHSPIVTSIHYDIVIVDEAHHVRNRRTMAWELVNQIQKKFIFLLTATPVQNNLIELYNLITLLNPGQFKTEKLFKEEYVARGNLRKPLNKDKLRALLRDCMIRNTRSAIDIKLPKRYATTLRLDPTEHEKEVYTRLNHYLRTHNLKKPTINLLLREAGSSPFALKESLLKLDDKKAVAPVIEQFTDGFDIAKGKALVEILKKNPGEKKLIFTQFIKSLDYITNVLTKQGIPYVRFEGTMTTREKNEAVARFRDKVPVFVSTESGGEGRNLQFCNTIINFDLPWNPMRIEQRIGRLHRIGQTRDVFIFNLTVKNTIEDYIIDILDGKINMFEMVIGEIEPILGHIGREEDFEDIILDIWMKSATEEQVKEEFEQLGQEMMKAKKAYLKTRQLDDEIFGEDYEA